MSQDAVNAKYVRRLNEAIRQLPAPPKTNLVDRFVGLFRPSKLVERGQQRYAALVLDQAMKRTHMKAAELNRLNEAWRTTDEDVNHILRKELRRARNRSRWLFTNAPNAVSIMNALLNYVIGTGMSMQSRVARPVSAIDPETGESYIDMVEMEAWTAFWEDIFNAWAEDPDVHSSESTPDAFADDQKLALRKIIEDGEVFVHYVIDKTHPILPLRLEYIEPDALDETITEYNGNPVIMGVEVDKNSYKPLAYWVRTRADAYNTTGYDFKSTRVPAASMLHIFLKLRPKQVRGIPWVAAVTENFYQLDQFTDAELIANRIAACFAAFVTAPAGQNGPAFVKPGDATKATDSDGNVLATLEPGLIASLPPGASVSFASPQKPGATFGMFTEYNDRKIGAGVQGGLSYEMTTRDTSKTAYAGGRLAQLMDFQTFRWIQVWFARKHNAPIARKALQMAVLTNRIAAPGYYDRDGRRFWEKHEWMPAGWTWGINPLQEVRASIESMKAGLTTYAQECAFLGGDWESNLRMMARIKRRCQRLKVTLPWLAGTDQETIAPIDPAAAEQIIATPVGAPA